MSVLWALTGTSHFVNRLKLKICTGSLDPRPVSENKQAEVAHTTLGGDVLVAQVTVQGLVNGHEFTVTRTRGPRKGDLRFTLDQTDRTQQSIKETQNLIGMRKQSTTTYAKHVH
jgi:hypothetical protein